MGTSANGTGIASLAAMALHLDMARETLRRLVASNVLERNADGSFDLDLCRVRYIKHLRERTAKTAQMRDRLSEAKARSIEQRLKRENAELCLVSDFTHAVQTPFFRMVSHLMQLPARHHPHDLGERRRLEALILEARTATADDIASERERLEAAAIKSARKRT